MSVLNSLRTSKSPFKTETVEVPELGDDAQVIIKEMTANRLLKWQDAISDDSDFSMIHLIIACMVDDEGNQCHEHSDAEFLHEALPMSVSSRLFEACKSVNESIFTDISTKKKN